MGDIPTRRRAGVSLRPTTWFITLRLLGDTFLHSHYILRIGVLNLDGWHVFGSVGDSRYGTSAKGWRLLEDELAYSLTWLSRKLICAKLSLGEWQPSKPASRIRGYSSSYTWDDGENPSTFLLTRCATMCLSYRVHQPTPSHPLVYRPYAEQCPTLPSCSPSVRPRSSHSHQLNPSHWSARPSTRAQHAT